MAKNRILQLRKSRGLTQRALAELAGTSQQQVQRIEAGVQGVRLELATRMAEALGCHLADIFPALAPERKKSLKDSRYVLSHSKLTDAGIDPDPNHWTAKLFAHDGRVFLYRIASDEKDRLEKIFGRVDNGMVAFATMTHWVAVNRAKVAAAQFLFDRGLLPEEDASERPELKLHLISAEEPITFGVVPDDRALDEDEDGASSQLQRMFFELEMGLEDQVVLFDDEDNERVYIRPTEILALEVPIECCEPALWNAQMEGETEDEEVERKSAHLSGEDKR
jgi:transcriptional regulator with XRE-family HTH domain